MILKSGIIIAFWTLISRITGFLRDSIMANYLGSGVISDCLVAAAKLPNSFRRLLAEGAMSSVFVPIFSQYVAQGKKKEGVEFASKIFSFLFIFLIILVLILEIFMPQVINFLSPGFKEIPNKFELTVKLARINFIFLITISLTALLGGVLNSLNKFAYFAATPVMLNVGLVLTFILFPQNNEKIGYIISYSTVLIGSLQLILMFFVCKKYRINIKIKFFKIDSEMKIFLKKMINGLIGSGIYQVNIFVDGIFASMFMGGMSYLYYTDRINQLPLTLIGGTLGVGLLPILSKYIKLKELNKIAILHNQCIVFAIFASAFCVTSIASLGKEMVSFIYERGSFVEKDTIIVTKMLLIFSFGFIFSIFSKIYNAFLFANGDTKKPMLIGLICTIINIIINISTYKIFGFFCVVYATLISSILSGLLPLFFVNKMKIIQWKFSILFKLILTILISFIVYYLQLTIFHALFFKSKYINMILTLGTSGILYCFLSILLHIYSIKELKCLFKKNANNI